MIYDGWFILRSVDVSDMFWHQRCPGGAGLTNRFASCFCCLPVASNSNACVVRWHGCAMASQSCVHCVQSWTVQWCQGLVFVLSTYQPVLDVKVLFVLWVYGGCAGKEHKALLGVDDGVLPPIMPHPLDRHSFVIVHVSLPFKQQLIEAWRTSKTRPSILFRCLLPPLIPG